MCFNIGAFTRIYNFVTFYATVVTKYSSWVIARGFKHVKYVNIKCNGRDAQGPVVGLRSCFRVSNEEPSQIGLLLRC